MWGAAPDWLGDYDSPITGVRHWHLQGDVAAPEHVRPTLTADECAALGHWFLRVWLLGI